ncbi:MAG TPA: SDR family oxidoreductase [Verrucomicrobiae bacterium]|nr:SDR family oxidoreductase [Verrucomicrobiae bacterium]
MRHGPAWITGAGGLIGSYLVKTAPNSYHPVALTRESFDLADFSRVRREFQSAQPGLLIHCAALSRSPACQADPARARKQNVEVTAHLAELASDIPFVFFSSDLVFDGRAGNYDELSAVNPLSVYAETKVQAERIVLANPRHMVVRTSLNCGISPTADRGFDEQLKCAWQRGQVLRLFQDEFRCPISAEATSRAVWELVSQSATGLFHVAGAERLSRWEIGQLVAAGCPELDCRMEPALLKEYQGAPRAPDTSLNCAKAQAKLSFPLPRLSEWLKSERSGVISR